MRCPVCGSKMFNGRCKYCNVTDVQVKSASNAAAKKAIKNHEKEKVVYTANFPTDLSVKKTVLLTVFLGLVGAGNFYVGKTVKGIVSAVGFGLMFVFCTISVLASKFSWGIQDGMAALVTLFSLFGAVAAIIWIMDIVALLFKTYKVPVVMEGYTLPEE